MENVTVTDVILGKKMDSYGTNNNDFKAQGELTVEITLSEYRNLIKDCATASARIDKAEKDKYERSMEIKSLKEVVEVLKAENYELKKALESKNSPAEV